MDDKNVKSKLIEDEMKHSYIDYAMSVITQRALPDVKDGLKPVHRRILYSMYRMGLNHTKSFVKSARIVGDTFKYHPHGDSAIYDSLVRMAQVFSLRYPLVWGHGNFGGASGEFSAAHMRYTEAKLAKISNEMLTDIDKETVDFCDNFDGSLQEPLVLPAKLPNLLLNGSSGIAVGMATNIPPHNLKEVCDAVIALVNDPSIDYKSLMGFVKGPDFPTGGFICGTVGIKSAYKTGRGKIIMRGKAEVEENKIIVTEIPYMVNKSLLIQSMASLVKEKIVDGISYLRDESDRKGMRLVVGLKRDANGEIILNQLYKHTSLQVTFGANMLALVDGQPKVLGLKEIIEEFIKHRKEVIVRRTKFDLDKAEKRAHILEGLKIALSNIDAIVKLIKGSSNVAEALQGLMSCFKLSEEQGKAILEMKLQKLTTLETSKINEEYDSLMKLIIELKSILESEEKVKEILKKDMLDLKTNYRDERRTFIIESYEEIETEDLIEEDKVVVTVTHAGYVKRVSSSTYRAQRRGGKGVKGASTREEDFVEHLFVTGTHDYLLFFTNKGIVHWLKAYQVPEGSRYAKGTAIINLVRMDKDEKISAVIPVKDFGGYLVMATENGNVKKTLLNEYSRPRQGGIIGINLKKGDRLVDVKRTDGNMELMLATRDGRAVRFNEADVRSVGRNSSGVRGILVRGSKVVGMGVCDAEYLLTVTDKGYGKRTLVRDYRLISRGGSGVRNIKCTPKNGKVVGIKVVGDLGDVMLISREGIIIRTPVKDISVIGRNTQGLRVMRLDVGDSLVSVAKVVDEE